MNRIPIKTSMKDIYWLAGLLEGEGSFTLAKFSPAVRLRMTDKDVVTRVARLFNRSVSEYEGRPGDKQVYVTTIGGSDAIEWMFTLYSELGVRRREQIRQVVEVWRTRHVGRSPLRSHCKKGHPLITRENGKRNCLVCKKEWDRRDLLRRRPALQCQSQ